MSDATDHPGRDALGWVQAGYGEGRWPGMLDARTGRLFRLGIWWKHSGAPAPVSVDEISDRILMIDHRILVTDNYGDIVMNLEISNSGSDTLLSAPAKKQRQCSARS